MRHAKASKPEEKGTIMEDKKIAMLVIALFH